MLDGEPLPDNSFKQFVENISMFSFAVEILQKATFSRRINLRLKFLIPTTHIIF